MLGKHLYPPEMVMRFQDDIGITSAQRKVILKELKRTQSEITDLKFSMHGEASKLGKLVSAAKVNEKKALAQSDRVIDIERKVKRLHLRLLLRIKNLLTSAQKAKLDKVKAKFGRLTPPATPSTPRTP